MPTPNRFLFRATLNGTLNATSLGLFVSDGTAAGTTLLKTFPNDNPDPLPGGFRQLGTKVVFIATTLATGAELWVTDGTAAGTVLLRDIAPGTTGGSIALLPAAIDSPTPGTLLFVANDGTTGRELWVTDGTAAGTKLLKDIFPGTSPSNPAEFVRLGSQILFQATADNNRYLALWRTDGTASGTVQIVPDLFPFSAKNITALGTTGRALFNAFGDQIGQELWVTDGTTAGTVLLKDLLPGLSSSDPRNFLSLGATGRVVFVADTALVGGSPTARLWSSDGTAAGTYEIKAGLTYTNTGANVVAALGAKALFWADDGTGQALWSTDGTAGNAVRLTTGPNAPAANYSNDGSGYGVFTALGSKLLFWDNANNTYASPWVTDGTPAGTFQLGSEFLGNTSGFAVIGSQAYFNADGFNFSGNELYTTDGTVAGTRLLQNINPMANGSSSPQQFVVLNGQLYFQANDGTHGAELMSLSGLVTDIYPGFAPSAPRGLTAVFLPCFAEGTGIRTPGGRRAVEALRLGDMVLTASGEARAIAWVGQRSVVPQEHARPADVSPVRVLPDAFGPGMPSATLRLSPDHAVFVDGVLVPVRHLVNGTTVAREAVEAVTWHHLELESHDVLLAEGLPAESYLDTGNRESLLGEPAAAPRVPPCAPIVTQGPAVDRVRVRLAAIAAALGHAPAPEHAVVLDAVGLVHATVPAGAGFVRLRCPSCVPEGERRRLGAAVTALALDGAPIGLEDVRLVEGFHPSEGEESGAGGQWRWSDGDALLAIGPATTDRALAVQVVSLAA